MLLQTFKWTKTQKWRNPHTYLLQKSWMHIFACDCCKWLKERFFFIERAIRTCWFLSPCFTGWCLVYGRKLNELLEGSGKTCDLRLTHSASHFLSGPTLACTFSVSQSHFLLVAVWTNWLAKVLRTWIHWQGLSTSFNMKLRRRDGYSDKLATAFVDF